MICKVNVISDENIEVILPKDWRRTHNEIKCVSVRDAGRNDAKVFNVGNWINASDKLPNTDEIVLVVKRPQNMKPYLAFCFIDSLSKKWADLAILSDLKGATITHWMPIPALPEDNA